MTAAERYRQDPTFHMLVDQLGLLFEKHCGSGAGITPTEIREAAGLAWQLYAERHALPVFIREEVAR